MSNSAQLLVHNIRAMQSPSIQAKRDGQRQDFRRGTRGASDTHTHAHVHTQHAAAAEQTQQPSRATGHRGSREGSEELQCQHESWWSNITLTKTKIKRGNCWGGRGISCQAQSAHLRPWGMHSDLWSCAVPGRSWWPTCPILAVLLKPHHQKVKIYIASTEAKEIRRIFTG